MAYGIIAEYNPFHNGHLYHLRTASKGGTEDVVVIMSGHYVQRGEPALLDQWTRTKMALLGGASVVLALPTPFSTASSEYFASAAIRILSETGLISHLSFGAETTDLTLLSTLADILAEEPAAYRSYLAENLAEGLGFAAARALALETMTGQSLDIMHRPNTILALEYLKALKQQKSDIIPVPVLRQGDYHDSDSVLYPSASSIRDRFGSGEAIRAFIPEGPYEVFKQAPKAKVFDTWSDILYDRMLHHTAETLRTIRDVEEGLEGRLLSVLDRPMPLTEAVEKLSTKRYPKARIRRILLAILLDIKKEEVQNKNPGYIRVLGFRKEAEPLISAMAKNAKVPVITNLNRQMKDLPVTLQEALRKEMLRTDLYYAHVDDPPASVRAKDLTQPLILI